MMIDFMNGLDDRIVIALGFFDSVHIGHRFLINNTIRLSQEKTIKSAVFTFRENLHLNYKQVYTFDERQEIIKALGVDHIVSAPISKDILSLTPNQFLDSLNDLYDIDSIVVGNDFKFGINASGNVEYLKKYMSKKGIEVINYDFVKYMNTKVSTSDIRDLLINGKINLANNLLGAPFAIKGNVISGCGRGQKMGFPTANVELPQDKVNILEGVYATACLVDDKLYDSVTNVGSRPTFDSYDNRIESFIENYEGSLYGKNIKVYFYERLRDIEKFANMDKLIEQINKDLELSHRIIRRVD